MLKCQVCISNLVVLLGNTWMWLLTCFSFFSMLYVETADRPGLLVDLVKIITDINIAVESGEFDTEVCIYHYPKNAIFFFWPSLSE